MKMSCVAVLLWSLGVAVLSGETNDPRSRLLTASPQEFHAYLAQVTQERRDAVAELCGFLAGNLAVFTNQNAQEAAKEVVGLLGDLRAPESIDPLLSVIDLPPSFIGTSPFDPKKYSAVIALAKIGPPAAEAAVEKARMTTVGDGDTKDVQVLEDRMKITLYACVIHGVFGDEMGAHYVNLKAGEDGRLEFLRKAYFLQFPGGKH
jgi:hypothetical protein